MWLGAELFSQVLKGFITGLGDDMKLIPHTSVSVLFLWIAALATYQFAWPQVSETQQKVDATVSSMQQLSASLDTVTKNLGKLNARLIKEDMDRALSDIETEKQQLAREISRLAQRGSVPDAMIERNERLTIILEQKKRDIAAFIARHPELMDASP
jgi:septal ring factor EnvC (AmiA/AmiB activator)